jgi:hypothetical protein
MPCPKDSFEFATGLGEYINLSIIVQNIARFPGVGSIPSIHLIIYFMYAIGWVYGEQKGL